MNGPFQLVDIVKGFTSDDRFGFLRFLDQLVDLLPRDITQCQLQFDLGFAQLPLLGRLAEPVELLRHPAQDFLQKVLAEVPVPHLQIDVFLNDRMAGLAEDGGEGGKGEVGLAGEPVGREDQEHFHLPATGGLELLAIEEDQLLGGSLTLRILYFHRELVPRLPGLEATETVRKPKGYNGKCIVRGWEKDIQGRAGRLAALA